MIFLLPFLSHTLLALQQRERTWYIDGHNLLGHKGTPRTVSALMVALEQVQGIEKVILVLDSKQSEPIQIRKSLTAGLETVTLSRDISADDYIRQQIGVALPHARVHVVTADRDLRRHVLQVKPVVRGVVNPVTFWRRYLPRLSGYKKATFISSAQADDNDSGMK